ncbi:competence protein ComK [Bacillus ndiopicus]|uniref:competence protein ComK n=1 Tax=Bacillus ndiopicus TaxID=1347368 RepID=UPI0005AABD5C|nr:competence protein ComK [Bacillus ndiopicus]
MNTDIKHLKSYYITNATYLLLPIKKDKLLHTLVYDKTGCLYVSQSPIKIVRASCRQMGSSYQSATDLSKQCLGANKHKLPIVVAVNYGDPCVIFPLMSPKSPLNVWVSFNSLINIQDQEGQINVTFKNFLDSKLDIQYTSFCKQYVSAAMLHKHLTSKWTHFS